jgi:hypothetical protein
MFRDRYVKRGIIFEAQAFQCVYCGQPCATYGILCAHEGRCDHRAKREQEYATARRKHIGRTQRGSNWNQQEAR